MSKKRLYILAIIIGTLLLIGFVYKIYEGRIARLEKEMIEKPP